jgi:hypothetical protein
MKYQIKQNSFDPFHSFFIFCLVSNVGIHAFNFGNRVLKVILLVMLKGDSVHRSRSKKCISKAIWETLSQSIYGDEKLAWDGKESNDEIFYMPPNAH